MKLDNYPYHGWDFAEVADALGIPSDTWNYIDNKPYPIWDWDDFIWLKHYIDSLFTHMESRPRAKFCKEVRIFLPELIKQEHTYWTPIWKGLLAIEEDFTFLQAVSCLIDHMWD